MNDQKSPYYVTEKDLWDDTIKLYETGQFPERLAKNILKMSKRIVGARRWDSCSDLLREEMISKSYTHACVQLINKKYNPKSGSKVYSWLTRVIINECLKAATKEQKERENFKRFAEEYSLFHKVEIPLKVSGEGINGKKIFSYV